MQSDGPPILAVSNRNLFLTAMKINVNGTSSRFQFYISLGDAFSSPLMTE